MGSFKRSLFLTIIDKENYDISFFHNATNTGRSRFDHIDHCFQFCKIEGLILEFGVYRGTTIKYIANKNPEDQIYGFDSFEGLPEDWQVSQHEKFNKHKKGYFAVDELPEVPSNVTLIKGFFNESLPKWKLSFVNETIRFLHIDSDLYSSAITVLSELNDLIQIGTVIRFDDFFPWSGKRYDRWEEGEYKALYDWICLKNRRAEILSRTDHWGCAIKILQ